MVTVALANDLHIKAVWTLETKLQLLISVANKFQAESQERQTPKAKRPRLWTAAVGSAFVFSWNQYTSPRTI